MMNANPMNVNDNTDGGGGDFGSMFDNSESRRGFRHRLQFPVSQQFVVDCYEQRRKQLEMPVAKCSDPACPLPETAGSVFRLLESPEEGNQQQALEVLIYSFPVSGAAARSGGDLTGLAIFPETHILCRWLLRHCHDAVVGKSVLEVGAGLGLPSHVALACGAKQVIVSDGCAAAMEHIHHPSLVKQTLLWEVDSGAVGEAGNEVPAVATRRGNRFDLVFGAGIAYKTANLPALIDTVRRHLKVGGLFACAFKKRQVSLEDLLLAVGRRHFEATEMNLVESEEEQLGVWTFRYKGE